MVPAVAAPTQVRGRDAYARIRDWLLESGVPRPAFAGRVAAWAGRAYARKVRQGFVSLPWGLCERKDFSQKHGRVGQDAKKRDWGSSRNWGNGCSTGVNLSV